MPVPFAINGLGRIGRALLRIAAGHADVEVVAANDVVAPEILVRLLRRDSVHGPFPGTVELAEGALVVNGRRIALWREADPAAVPWRQAGARLVVEATGEHLTRARAARHLGREWDAAHGRAEGVERVILTANAPDADVTLCLGVNDAAYDPARHRVVSNASCTTNALAPILKVLADRFGVERALMTAVHSYTVNQRLLDLPHPDPRRARAAALNMVPTATTAPAAAGRLLPGLAGRIEGIGVRVPTPEGAMLDLAVDLAADAGADDLRRAFRQAAAGELAGILGVSDEELVSSDFIGDPRSAVVDLPLLQVAGGRLARVVAWYDNEWGYATRLAELVARLGAS